MQYENVIVSVPREYTTEIARKFHHKPLRVMVSYAVDIKNGKKVCESFYYGALENHHKNIIWCKGLYAHFDKAVMQIEDAMQQALTNMEIAESIINS